MKILRYLLMASMTLGISGVAHGFSWNLQDPTGSSFVQVLPGVPFAFSFADCNVVEGNITYTGCANGQNISTTETLTSFDFTFANTAALGGASPDCVSDSFAVLTCSLSPDNSEYVLSFDCAPNTTCGIAPGGLFNLYENAVPGSQFPDVNGLAAGNTPEPSSIWLALSGMGSLGYLVRRRRRASSR
ncbi:MAG TPA: PEP-CTERM sorting domain-containing protein [Terracidiphilus sp.]